MQMFLSNESSHPNVFVKDLLQNAKCQKNTLKQIIYVIKDLHDGLSLYHTVPSFNDVNERPCENIVGKGESAVKRSINWCV